MFPAVYPLQQRLIRLWPQRLIRYPAVHPLLYSFPSGLPASPAAANPLMAPAVHPLMYYVPSGSTAFPAAAHPLSCDSGSPAYESMSTKNSNSVIHSYLAAHPLQRLIRLWSQRLIRYPAAHPLFRPSGSTAFPGPAAHPLMVTAAYPLSSGSSACSLHWLTRFSGPGDLSHPVAVLAAKLKPFWF